MTSATILASTSDANADSSTYRSRHYIESSQRIHHCSLENAAGDRKDNWDSTGYFDPYVKRTGLAYVGGSTLTKPTTYGSGVMIYNACAHLSLQRKAQLEAAYDSSNSLLIESRSDGTGTFTTRNNDKTISL
ncbi:MAG: hypothetical protein U0930_03670 [Pirellulales bacterium]